MNASDSDLMRDYLLDSGYELGSSLDKSDIVIVNTCSVRENAEHKALSYLGRLEPLKKKNKDLKVIFAGCMAQRVGERIKKRFPIVDLIIGAKDIEHFPHIFDDFVSCHYKTPATAGRQIGNCRKQTAQGKVCEFVTIMRGCENFCSYCVVPLVRGNEHSRPKDDIIKDINMLAENGTKEITLLGQNVNSYRDGSGRKRKIYDFADLLAEVDGIKGIERIRFMTSHPKDLSGRLIHAISKLEKVCEHIHLPLQSGSDRILKLMNRKYTFSGYYKTVQRLRSGPGNQLYDRYSCRFSRRN